MSSKQNKYCEFKPKNKCQGEGSGGHPGTIRSLDGGFCAKVTRSEKGKEAVFYQNQEDYGYKELDKFIPKFGGFCIGPESHKKYIAIENIKEGFEEPWEIDIKIGLRSASRSELKNRMNLIRGQIKKRVHILMDDYFSTSGQFGFRVENFSYDKEDGKKLATKTMPPQSVFQMYFKYDTTGKILKNFVREMEKFLRLIMEDGFDPYFLIASSLLFIYDKKCAENGNYNVVIKMIDFDHSDIVDTTKLTYSDKHFLRVNEYRYGVLTLVKELKYFFINSSPEKSLFVKTSKIKTKYRHSTKTSKKTKKKKRQKLLSGIKIHKIKLHKKIKEA